MSNSLKKYNSKKDIIEFKRYVNINKILILFINILIFANFVNGTFFHQLACQEVCENDFADELKNMCLEEFPLGDSIYSWECLNEHKEEYENDCLAEFPEYSNGQECVEENEDYYGDICVYEYEDEMNDFCWEVFADYMIENCDMFIDDSLIRGSTPECCEYEEQMYIDELDECIDLEQATCFEIGLCQYDTDDYCSGILNQEDECVSFEQGYCEETGGIWEDGYCISEGVEYNEFECTNWKNGFWVEDEEYCAETENEAECLIEGNFWSIITDSCYESDFEMECIEQEAFYLDGDCIESEDVYECMSEDLFFCENLGMCVESEDECCDEDGLFVSSYGVCAESIEQAECLNDDLYWSDSLDECFDLEDEEDCKENNFIWDAFFDTCYESNLHKACSVLNNKIWKNGQCVSKDSIKDEFEDKKSKNISLFFNNNFSYNVKSIRVLDSGNSQRDTCGYFSPDGNSFIYGVASNSNSQIDKSLLYHLMNFNENSNSFNFIRNALFYIPDYTKQFLTGWSKDASKNIYFVSKEKDPQTKLDLFKIRFFPTLNVNLESISPNKQLSSVNSAEWIYFKESELMGAKYYYGINEQEYLDKYYELYSNHSYFGTNVPNCQQYLMRNPADSKESYIMSKQVGIDPSSYISSNTHSLVYHNYMGINNSTNKTFVFDVLSTKGSYYNPAYVAYSNDGKYIALTTHGSSSSGAIVQIIKNDKNILNKYPINSTFEFTIPKGRIYDLRFDYKLDSNNIPKGMFFSLGEIEIDNKTLNSSIYYYDFALKRIDLVYNVTNNKNIVAIDINPNKNQILALECSKNSYDCELKMITYQRYVRMFAITPEPVKELNITQPTYKRIEILFDSIKFNDIKKNIGISLKATDFKSLKLDCSYFESIKNTYLSDSYYKNKNYTIISKDSSLEKLKSISRNRNIKSKNDKVLNHQELEASYFILKKMCDKKDYDFEIILDKNQSKKTNLSKEDLSEIISQHLLNKSLENITYIQIADYYISSYDDLVNFLKTKNIININGIRTDLSIEKLNIDISTGIIQEDHSQNAQILIEINQEILEEIILSKNPGQTFYLKFTEGKIKITNLEPSVFRKIERWIKNIFSNDSTDYSKNVLCSSDYEPVCANKKTYPNSCLANKAGITKYNEGEC